MREIYKTYSQKGKKQVKTTTISIALLVAAIFIIGAASPAMSTQTHTTKLKINDKVIEGNPTGIDPRLTQNLDVDLSAAYTYEQPIGPLAEEMYGFIVYGAGSGYTNGPCKWALDNPGEIEKIENQQTSNWLAGGTWTCDDRWLGCEYGTGVLYELDKYDGTQTSIGGGGIGCHGLGWDPVYNRLYATSGTQLIEYDPDTGEQTVIGGHGLSDTQISLQINLEGICTTYDVKFSGNAKLSTIDLETGEAIETIDMGENLLYAQDGAYDWETNILWLAAYSSTGFLAYWDDGAEELVHIDNFQGGAEIACAMISAPCIPPEHDIGIKSLDYPVTGPAYPDMEMMMTVKNSGNNTETFDAQMEIIKCEAGPLILEEYFDGTFPPAGWETDYWKQSFTNVAGGDSPEARCYKYDKGSQYYDNYIMTPQIDCTGLEKVNLRFRWASDVQYLNYCSVFVKFRRNSTSPWKDVTPWDNPIENDQEAFWWEIGCYGFGEPMGEEFQIKWEYIGYYYYFNYWWLDDVTLEACGGCAEYAELVEDITLGVGEEMQIEFPGWTPSEWQNESSENTWEEYPIHGIIYLDGDQNPRNNEKWKLIDLWYPWMHDIEVNRIDTPSERSLPGQTFPVAATMKNVGQFPECCIPIDVNIGEPVLLDQLLEESTWPNYPYNVPATGWTDEHKDYVYYYGWERSSYTSYAGGSPAEAMIRYYRCRADMVFYSYAIDASDYQILKLKFLTYVNHWYGSTYYSLEAGYSFDAKTWYAAWSEQPSSSGGWEVEAAIEGGGTVYIGFWCKGNPYYFNYWYLDNVAVEAYGFESEYSDFACQGPDIDPAEEVTFTFEDWTPDFLQYETTGTVEYLVEATIEMEGDKNPGNDILTEELTLDYWHDVGIKDVTSPAPNKREAEEYLHYDDGTNVNALGLTAGGTFEYAIRLTPDELAGYGSKSIVSVRRHHGYTSDFYMEGKMKIYGHGSQSEPGDLIYEQPFEIEENGWHEVDLESPIPINEDEDIWVSVEVTHSAGQYPAGMDPSGPVYYKSDWIMLSGNWNEVYIYGFYTDWNLQAGIGKGGVGAVDTYIQPGTEDIECTVENIGTFPELDLICYANISEFITDPNGTLLWENNITNIDLDEPLGGSEDLDFGSFTFAMEGIYGLFINLPDDNDDKAGNNLEIWGVGVDDTDPVCEDAIIDPDAPTGEGKWYVDDVTVSINASDPISQEVASGVKEIRYTINGAETTVSGDQAVFVMTEDGEDILVEYWAIDNVGNVGPKKSFEISIDQTVPEVSLTYEVTGGNMYQGWDFTFTAEATDETSGMVRVEFFFNSELQETVEGPGPIYEWTLRYWPIPRAIFKAVAFDEAGLNDYDEIIDPETSSHSTPQTQQSKEVPNQQPLPR
jgi:hypothetical protein